MLKTIVCLAMLVATPAMAQDYYAPLRNSMQQTTNEMQRNQQEYQNQEMQRQQLQQMQEINRNLENQNSNSGN